MFNNSGYAEKKRSQHPGRKNQEIKQRDATGSTKENDQLQRSVIEAHNDIEDMRKQLEELKADKEDTEQRRLQQQQREEEQKARDITKAPALKQLESDDDVSFAHWKETIKTLLYGYALEDIVVGSMETPYKI